MAPRPDWQSMKKTVLERNCHMFNNPLMSDITFTCGQSKLISFFAHKYVLATSSPVFYAMFYGDLAEKVKTIHLSDADEESLHEFLHFLYTDQCTLTLNIVFPVMYLAKKYMISSLTEKCLEVIQESIKPENVLTILEPMILFDEAEIVKKCWEVIDIYTSQAVTSEALNDIHSKTLITLLKRNTLNIAEVELFQALVRWSEYQCLKNNLKPSDQNKRAILGDSLYQIRFLSMTQEEFMKNVSSSGLLTDEEIALIFETFEGFEAPSLKWNQPKRQLHSSNLQYFARFSSGDIKPPTTAWHYAGKPDRLSFSVNTPAVFHGVRLFGDTNGSNYDVSLTVNSVNITGIYTSELKDKGIYGFDVMLPAPIVIDQNTIVTMAATIAGPNSYYGNNGEALVEVDGITVVFRDAPGSSNGTGVAQGQFAQIILSF